MPDDQRARAVARSQHGVVGDRQSNSLQIGSRHRSSRLATGAWEKLGDRSYVLAGVPLTDRAKSMAAVLDVRGDAYLSHTSAAWLWGIPGFDLEPIHVARRYEGTRRPSRLARIHNLRGVPDAHLGEVDGIPVASPVLTCFQVAAATASRARTERAVDNVLVMGLARTSTFHSLLRTLAERGRNGIRIMRSILEERPPGYRPPESGNETRFQVLCDRYGIRLRRQVEIGDDDHFVTRVDFQDVDYPKLVYRIQSARWHGAVSHARDDADQKRQLEKRFEVVDIWDRDLWRHPNKVMAAVTAARLRALHSVVRK